MTESPHSGGPRQKISRVEVYWTNVTYKTVAIYLVMILAILLAVIYLINPAWINGAVDRIGKMIGRGDSAPGPVVAGQVRFMALDPPVQVKKVNSVNWENATLGTTLDKGDLIRTGPEGLARLQFADGTTTTVKADTLMTVEENSVSRDRSTNVGVHISSGTVDLTTPTWDTPGSKAQVSFAGATASMKQNSRAAVHSEGGTNQGDITMVSGSADLQHDGQSVSLNRYEKASVTPGGPIVKTNVLAPPDLLAPLNLQPLIEQDPKQANIRFEWKPVPEAGEYILRVSSNASFNKAPVERRVKGTSAEVTGLDSGDYFWNVTAISPTKKESEASDTYKFTLVAQGKGQEMMLEVDQTVLHGNVVEIIGRTEPNAALIVNGQHVADITADGHFRHFTEPMTRGSQTIVITGQNRRGGTQVKRVQIVIP
jgi:hypothetical protein